MKQSIQLTINGVPRELEVEPDRKLLWVLRSDLGLMGTKWGCLEGLCGACTVLVGGKALLACQYTVKELEGKAITTIEGLSDGVALDPLQKAFMEHDALQCGYCTPGMIMAARALLNENPSPTRQEILDGMEGNLCRCGAHTRIVKAIEAVAGRSSGGGR